MSNVGEGLTQPHVFVSFVAPNETSAIKVILEGVVSVASLAYSTTLTEFNNVTTTKRVLSNFCNGNPRDARN